MEEAARQMQVRIAHAQSTLQRLADALGRPVETFAAGASSDGLADDGAELLRLWFQIGRPDDRRKVLELARFVAAAQDA